MRKRALDDNLLIHAPPGAVFSLRELWQSGGGGAEEIPLPPAASPTLASLAALALVAAGVGIKTMAGRRRQNLRRNSKLEFFKSDSFAAD